MGAALVIESTFTSYYTGECESHSEEFAGAGTFATLAAAALFAAECNADGGFDHENTEPDFAGDVRRSTRSYFAIDAAEWQETLERERREREEALMPFGSEWYAEQREAGRAF
jgi:hypothetical protein